MRLECLLDIGAALLHKNGWIAIAMASSLVSVGIPFYHRVWFSAGDYGVTGLDVAWTMATVLVPLSIFKVGLGCFEHILEIRIKKRKLKSTEVT